MPTLPLEQQTHHSRPDRDERSESDLEWSQRLKVVLQLVHQKGLNDLEAYVLWSASSVVDCELMLQ